MEDSTLLARDSCGRVPSELLCVRSLHAFSQAHMLAGVDRRVLPLDDPSKRASYPCYHRPGSQVPSGETALPGPGAALPDRGRHDYGNSCLSTVAKRSACSTLFRLAMRASVCLPLNMLTK